MLVIDVFVESLKVSMDMICLECRKPIGTKACIHIKSDLGLRFWVHADCVKVDGQIGRVLKCSR